MSPIFFPTTYLSQSSIDVCHEWFEKISVYQPSDIDIPDHYKNNQRLIIKLPLASHLDRQKFIQERSYLKSLGNDFGPKMDHLKTRPADPPFFDESSVHRIRAQIKQKTHPQHQVNDKQLLIALYSQLFQDYDMQQADLNRTLSEIEQSQTQLFQDLNHDLSDLSSQPKIHAKLDVTHISDRLKIWFHLYQHDQEKSGLFVTDNRDVILEMQEWNDDLEFVFRIDPSQMANAKQKLQDYLGLQLYQLSLTPVKTKKVLVYHKKNQLVGPFIPSSLTTCENIRMILLE
jgi:hypothetical protein